MRASSLYLLAGGFVLLAGCARQPSDSLTAGSPLPVRVSVASVQREALARTITIPGTVRPVERAVVAAKISGVIESLPVILGQTVQRGDLLVRLTAPELAARLAQTRAQLDQAEREEKRNRDLAASGADTTDAARAAAEHLQAVRGAFAEASAMLAYTEIRAPYDGRIAQKLAYPGDFASPSQPLLVLERTAALEIEAVVPASLAPTLTLGTPLSVAVTGVATPFRGTVAEIAAAADPITHTVLVKLALPATDLALSGRAAQVELPGPPTETLLVPATAVTRLGQMERAFVVSDGRAQLRLVKTGATQGTRVELLAGLTAGEQVVVTPPATLHDGQPVVGTP